MVKTHNNNHFHLVILIHQKSTHPIYLHPYNIRNHLPYRSPLFWYLISILNHFCYHIRKLHFFQMLLKLMIAIHLSILHRLLCFH
nr:MAG TPA: hypothetical protein [Caudoviricetes sp.]